MSLDKIFKWDTLNPNAAGQYNMMHATLKMIETLAPHGPTPPDTLLYTVPAIHMPTPPSKGLDGFETLPSIQDCAL